MNLVANLCKVMGKLDIDTLLRKKNVTCTAHKNHALPAAHAALGGAAYGNSKA
jgi:hypothetical protein